MTVTDFDADQAIQPMKRAVQGRYSTGDKVLVGAGVLLAAMAAFFPWYVFLNPEKFSVPALWEGTTRDLPETAAKEVMSVSPAAMVDNDNDPGLESLDPVSTATAPSVGEKDKSLGAPVETGLDQPLPASSGFRLMHVANGRALIEDASGMYIVRVGSILPDNSRLATLEQRDGAWVIVTSNGDIIKRN
jgi:hypothetical protein